MTDFHLRYINDLYNNQTFTDILNNLAIHDYINETQIQDINNSINNIINNNYYVDDNILLIIYEKIRCCGLNINNNIDINGFTLHDLRIIINDLSINQINNFRCELFIIYFLLKQSYQQQHNIHLTNNNNNNITTAASIMNNIHNIRNNLIQNTRNAIINNNINPIQRNGLSTGELISVFDNHLYKITCPFCRKKNDRTGWINTNKIDICEICFHDNKIMYKSNKCEHKICKHCVDNIKK